MPLLRRLLRRQCIVLSQLQTAPAHPGRRSRRRGRVPRGGCRVNETHENDAPVLVSEEELLAVSAALLAQNAEAYEVLAQ